MNNEILLYEDIVVDIERSNLVEIWKATGSDPNKDPWSWIELDENQTQIEFDIDTEGGFFDDYVEMDASSYIHVNQDLAIRYARFIDPDIIIDSSNAVGFFLEPDQEGSNAFTRLYETIAAVFEEMIGKGFTNGAIQDWVMDHAENACCTAQHNPEMLSYLIHQKPETTEQ